MSPMERIVLVKIKHQEERGLWVPSSSKGRILDPHNLISSYNFENLKEMVKESQANPLRRWGGFLKWNDASMLLMRKEDSPRE